jgi:hypothetical protein
MRFYPVSTRINRVAKDDEALAQQNCSSECSARDVTDSDVFRKIIFSVLDREFDDEKILGPRGPRIRCPLCGWSPREEDKWFCTCGNEWNTFDTGGVCSACLHEWTSTQRLSCSRWSQHSEWYSRS